MAGQVTAGLVESGQVTAGLVESNGSLPPGFMTNVICGLTAKKLGSTPCPTLVIEYGTTLLYLLTLCMCCCRQISDPDSAIVNRGDLILMTVKNIPRWGSIMCH